MENENSKNKDSQEIPSNDAITRNLEASYTDTSGKLTDPHVLERLKAVAKSAKKSIKSRHTVTTTETIKVATAFGATNTEVTVEKEVHSQPKTDEEKKAALEAELDAQMKQKLGDAAVPVDPEKLAKAKEIRDALSSIWAIPGLSGANPEEAKERTERRQTDDKKYAGADQYIEGVSVDGNGATVNTEAGDSGVRIKFTSKPKN